MDDTFIYIGIDPGKQGGMAAIHDGKVWAVSPMLIGGDALNLVAIGEWFKSVANIRTIACIEKVGAMPGQGVTSMFTFGFVTGAIHGILATLEIPYHVVTPQAWKKEILAGTEKDKRAAIDFCLQTYPGVDLRGGPEHRVPHSGIADALCMATWASRHL